LIRWVWLGALLMALGGLLAAMDPRYRRLLARDRHAAGMPAAARAEAAGAAVAEKGV
jgi:cytochrome c-type biogenesis protein CcmF